MNIDSNLAIESNSNYCWNFGKFRLYNWKDKENRIIEETYIPFEEFTIDMVEYVIRTLQWHLNHTRMFDEKDCLVVETENQKLFFKTDFLKIPEEIRFMVM